MGEKAEPGKVVNTAEGHRVVQAGTIIGDINLAPEPRARWRWPAWSGLTAVTAMLVVLALQVWPGKDANDAPVPVAASTTSSAAPTTTTPTTTTTTPPPTRTITTAPTTSTVSSTAAMPPDVHCSSGTHERVFGPATACEVDNPAIDPAFAEASWSGGSKTVMVIGPSYYTYVSSNGGPFMVLGNGVANSQGDRVTYHRMAGNRGYFKISGTDRRGYCAEFWVENPGEPAEFRPWKDCRLVQ